MARLLGDPAWGTVVSAPRVAAVVVSYNVRELLLDCLASLDAARRAGELDEIVVVDNASADGSAAAARAVFPDVCVIEADNRGYGAGVNRGIAATRGRYVLALNPDTVVPPGTLRALADHLDAHPRCAVVGPRLRHPDGAVQPTRRRFPSRWTPVFESTIAQEWWPNNPWTRRYYVADRRDVAQSVDWLVGAALLVRRSAIERVGGFDESFRMYSEEVEWCWRFRRHGWTVDYLPCVEIIHHEGASTRQDVARSRLDFDRGRIRLTRRLHGERAALLVRVALLANYLLLGGREALKWLVGHRRELRRRRIKAYARALRGGLR